MPNSASTAPPCVALDWAKIDDWPYACKAAIGMVSQLVYWFSFLRP